MSGSEDTQKYGQSRGSKNVRQTNDEPLANFFVFDDLKSTLTFLSYKEKNKDSEWEEKLKFQNVIT